MSTKSTRSFCQKLVWQKNSGGSYVHSSFAIILMGKRELVALLSLFSWCLLIVVWLFLAVPWVSLQFVIVVFPDYTQITFFSISFDNETS